MVYISLLYLAHEIPATNSESTNPNLFSVLIWSKCAFFNWKFSTKNQNFKHTKKVNLQLLKTNVNKQQMLWKNQDHSFGIGLARYYVIPNSVLLLSSWMSWITHWTFVRQLSVLLMPRLELPLIILMTWICLHFRNVTRYTCRN